VRIDDDAKSVKSSKSDKKGDKKGDKKPPKGKKGSEPETPKKGKETPKWAASGKPEPKTPKWKESGKDTPP